ncbi:MAG: hypothetical protein AAGB03_08650, partial [Pseudomonadota bacterium]
LAPPGHQVFALAINYAPYTIKGGWERAGPKLIEQVLTTLEVHIPGLSDRLVAAQLVSPVELERRWGWRRGDGNGGLMTADQMGFMRPAPRISAYRYPIKGLYHCGAGSHPGGGLTGWPGRNGAQCVLSDRGQASVLKPRGAAPIARWRARIGEVDA